MVCLLPYAYQTIYCLLFSCFLIGAGEDKQTFIVVKPAESIGNMCEKCGRCYSTKSILRRHQKTVHPSQGALKRLQEKQKDSKLKTRPTEKAKIKTKDKLLVKSQKLSKKAKPHKKSEIKAKVRESLKAQGSDKSEPENKTQERIRSQEKSKIQQKSKVHDGSKSQDQSKMHELKGQDQSKSHEKNKTQDRPRIQDKKLQEKGKSQDKPKAQGKVKVQEKAHTQDKSKVQETLKVLDKIKPQEKNKSNEKPKQEKNKSNEKPKTQIKVALKQKSKTNKESKSSSVKNKDKSIQKSQIAFKLNSKAKVLAHVKVNHKASVALKVKDKSKQSLQKTTKVSSGKSKNLSSVKSRKLKQQGNKGKKLLGNNSKLIVKGKYKLAQNVAQKFKKEIKRQKMTSSKHKIKPKFSNKLFTGKNVKIGVSGKTKAKVAQTKVKLPTESKSKAEVAVHKPNVPKEIVSKTKLASGRKDKVLLAVHKRNRPKEIVSKAQSRAQQLTQKAKLIKAKLPITTTKSLVQRNSVNLKSGNLSKQPKKLALKNIVSKPFSCVECGVAFRTESQLKLHSGVHTLQTFRCFRCDEVFVNLRSFTKHFMSHTDDVPESVHFHKCATCFEKFEFESQLNIHMKAHEARAAQLLAKYQCEICKLQFDEHVTLKQHIQDNHEVLKCVKCGRTYFRLQELQAHLEKSHGMSTRDARAAVREKRKVSMSSSTDTNRETEVLGPKENGDSNPHVTVGFESMRGTVKVLVEPIDIESIRSKHAIIDYPHAEDIDAESGESDTNSFQEKPMEIDEPVYADFGEPKESALVLNEDELREDLKALFILTDEEKPLPGETMEKESQSYDVKSKEAEQGLHEKDKEIVSQTRDTETPKIGASTTTVDNVTSNELHNTSRGHLTDDKRDAFDDTDIHVTETGKNIVGQTNLEVTESNSVQGAVLKEADIPEEIFLNSESDNSGEDQLILPKKTMDLAQAQQTTYTTSSVELEKQSSESEVHLKVKELEVSATTNYIESPKIMRSAVKINTIKRGSDISQKLNFVEHKELSDGQDKDSTFLSDDELEELDKILVKDESHSKLPPAKMSCPKVADLDVVENSIGDEEDSEAGDVYWMLNKGEATAIEDVISEEVIGDFTEAAGVDSKTSKGNVTVQLIEDIYDDQNDRSNTSENSQQEFPASAESHESSVTMLQDIESSKAKTETNSKKKQAQKDISVFASPLFTPIPYIRRAAAIAGEQKIHEVTLSTKKPVKPIEKPAPVSPDLKSRLRRNSVATLVNLKKNISRKELRLTANASEKGKVLKMTKDKILKDNRRKTVGGIVTKNTVKLGAKSVKRNKDRVSGQLISKHNRRKTVGSAVSTDEEKLSSKLAVSSKKSRREKDNVSSGTEPQGARSSRRLLSLPAEHEVEHRSMKNINRKLSSTDTLVKLASESKRNETILSPVKSSVTQGTKKKKQSSSKKKPKTIGRNVGKRNMHEQVKNLVFNVEDTPVPVKTGNEADELKIQHDSNEKTTASAHPEKLGTITLEREPVLKEGEAALLTAETGPPDENVETNFGNTEDRSVNVSQDIQVRVDMACTWEGINVVTTKESDILADENVGALSKKFQSDDNEIGSNDTKKTVKKRRSAKKKRRNIGKKVEKQNLDEQVENRVNHVKDTLVPVHDGNETGECKIQSDSKENTIAQIRPKELGTLIQEMEPLLKESDIAPVITEFRSHDQNFQSHDTSTEGKSPDASQETHVGPGMECIKEDMTVVVANESNVSSNEIVEMLSQNVESDVIERSLDYRVVDAKADSQQDQDMEVARKKIINSQKSSEKKGRGHTQKIYGRSDHEQTPDKLDNSENAAISAIQTAATVCYQPDHLNKTSINNAACMTEETESKSSEGTVKAILSNIDEKLDHHEEALPAKCETGSVVTVLERLKDTQDDHIRTEKRLNTLSANTITETQAEALTETQTKAPQVVSTVVKMPIKKTKKPIWNYTKSRKKRKLSVQKTPKGKSSEQESNGSKDTLMTNPGNTESERVSDDTERADKSVTCLENVVKFITSTGEGENLRGQSRNENVPVSKDSQSLAKGCELAEVDNNERETATYNVADGTEFTEQNKEPPVSKSGKVMKAGKKRKRSKKRQKNCPPRVVEDKLDEHVSIESVKETIDTPVQKESDESIIPTKDINDAEEKVNAILPAVDTDVQIQDEVSPSKSDASVSSEQISPSGRSKVCLGEIERRYLAEMEDSDEELPDTYIKWQQLDNVFKAQGRVKHGDHANRVGASETPADGDSLQCRQTAEKDEQTMKDKEGVDVDDSKGKRTEEIQNEKVNQDGGMEKNELSFSDASREIHDPDHADDRGQTAFSEHISGDECGGSDVGLQDDMLSNQQEIKDMQTTGTALMEEAQKMEAQDKDEVIIVDNEMSNKNSPPRKGQLDCAESIDTNGSQLATGTCSESTKPEKVNQNDECMVTSVSQPKPAPPVMRKKPVYPDHPYLKMSWDQILSLMYVRRRAAVEGEKKIHYTSASFPLEFKIKKEPIDYDESRQSHVISTPPNRGKPSHDESQKSQTFTGKRLKKKKKSHTKRSATTSGVGKTEHELSKSKKRKAKDSVDMKSPGKKLKKRNVDHSEQISTMPTKGKSKSVHKSRSKRSPADSHQRNVSRTPDSTKVKKKKKLYENDEAWSPEHIKDSKKIKKEKIEIIEELERNSSAKSNKVAKLVSKKSKSEVKSEDEEIVEKRMKITFTGIKIKKEVIDGQVKQETRYDDGRERPFVCRRCGKSFLTETHLRIHMMIHSGAKPHKCDVCGKCFRQRSTLKQHKYTHLEEAKKPYLCTICNKGFIKRVSYKCHMVGHTDSSLTTCKQCGRHFTSTISLKQHEVVHLPVRPEQCNVCFKKFFRKSHLDLHMRIHTNEKPYECQYCQKRFRQAATYRGHVLTHKPPEERIQCGLCDKTFTTLTQLKEHNIVHKIGRPKCDVCNESFSTMRNLERHKQFVHLQEDQKQFECNICGTKFSRIYYLIVHQRIHDNLKPYECEICHRFFRQLSTLQKHILTHNVDRSTTYRCSMCRKLFSTDERRILHEERHKAKGWHATKKVNKYILMTSTETQTSEDFDTGDTDSFEAVNSSTQADASSTGIELTSTKVDSSSVGVSTSTQINDETVNSSTETDNHSKGTVNSSIQVVRTPSSQKSISKSVSTNSEQATQSEDIFEYTEEDDLIPQSVKKKFIKYQSKKTSASKAAGQRLLKAKLKSKGAKS